jgi:hypothetical protein
MRSVALFADKQRIGCDHVEHALRGATSLTPSLFSKVVTDVCTRFVALARTGHREQLAQLVLIEAWTDAALFLAEGELPMWHLRRLIYDGGEWVCSLSRHPGIPAEIDDAADGRHVTRPIAILLSLVEAKRLTSARERVCTVSVPHLKPVVVHPICCDNFS